MAAHTYGIEDADVKKPTVKLRW